MSACARLSQTKTTQLHPFRSGVLILGTSDYVNDSYTNDIQQGLRLKKLEDSSSIRQECFPPNVNVFSSSESNEVQGYLNYDGGWAEAGKAMTLLTRKVISLGAKLVLGKQATRLVRKDGVTHGVECHDGTVFESTLLILAAGPWTPSIFPELGHGNKDISVANG